MNKEKVVDAIVDRVNRPKYAELRGKSVEVIRRSIQIWRRAKIEELKREGLVIVRRQSPCPACAEFADCRKCPFGPSPSRGCILYTSVLFGDQFVDLGHYKLILRAPVEEDPRAIVCEVLEHVLERVER